MFSCNERKRTGNEAVMVFLGILDQKLLERTEETHDMIASMEAEDLKSEIPE
jgi:hypothetical protein